MQTPPRKGHAVADPWSHLRLWLTAGGGVATDLVSKALLWDYLNGPPETGGRVVSVIPGCLRLVASENPGIVFGINVAEWLHLGDAAGQVLTALLTLLTAGLIFYVFAASEPRHRGMHVWCGLILAGAAGNLYDRLVFGCVRDVFQFTVEVSGRPLWPFVFNAADVFLVVGVALLALGILFSARQEPRPTEGAA
ncbi:MAG: signal peptidase II [Planctomycetes bacterium]|nr:signal peptidase II [Planctomycetota bacterium]